VERWPWFGIILGVLAVGMLVPLPFDGWLNQILFWGAVFGALAYGAHARQAK
jgi:hypothetical protein